ncbi:hypothetical protein ACLLKL_001938 [Escherichia coli]
MKKLIAALALITASAGAHAAGNWSYYQCNNGNALKVGGIVAEYHFQNGDFQMLGLTDIINNGQGTSAASVISQGQIVGSIIFDGRSALLTNDGTGITTRCIFTGTDASRAKAREQAAEARKQEEQRRADAAAKEKAAADAKRAETEKAWARNKQLFDQFNAQHPDMEYTAMQGRFLVNNNGETKYTCDLVTFAPIGENQWGAIKYVKNGFELVYTDINHASATFAPYMEITKTVTLDNRPWDMKPANNGDMSIVNKDSKDDIYYGLANCGASF